MRRGWTAGPSTIADDPTNADDPKSTLPMTEPKLWELWNAGDPIDGWKQVASADLGYGANHGRWVNIMVALLMAYISLEFCLIFSSLN